MNWRICERVTACYVEPQLHRESEDLCSEINAQPTLATPESNPAELKATCCVPCPRIHWEEGELVNLTDTLWQWNTNQKIIFAQSLQDFRGLSHCKANQGLAVNRSFTGTVCKLKTLTIYKKIYIYIFPYTIYSIHIVLFKSLKKNVSYAH